mgnify:CR=1 FL=1
MTEKEKFKIIDPQGKEAKEIMWIPIEKIILPEENVRKMTAEQFNLLCQSIAENGYVELIQVVKYGDKYKVVNGVHRFLALRDVFGWKEVPCIVVGENWDEVRYWSEVVRLNAIHGDFDIVALTKKVNEIRRRTNWDIEELRRRLGFDSKNKLIKRILSQVENTLPPEAKKKLKKTKKEIETIEDLSRIIHEIMKKYGSTLDKNFMIFSFAGKEHMLVICDAELWNLVQALADTVVDKEADMREAFKRMIKRELGMVI